MVYLTLIRQAEIGADDVGLTVKMAERLFLLSKALVEKFGKPQRIYSSKSYITYLMANICNLAFNAESIGYFSALKSDATRREIRAFFDFIQSDADHLGHSHIVVICASNVYEHAFIHLNAIGYSTTLSNERWKNLLQAPQTSWSTQKTASQSVEDANFIADNIENATCSNDDAVLIQQTIAEICDKFIS